MDGLALTGIMEYLLLAAFVMGEASTSIVAWVGRYFHILRAIDVIESSLLVTYIHMHCNEVNKVKTKRTGKNIVKWSSQGHEYWHLQGMDWSRPTWHHTDIGEDEDNGQALGRTHTHGSGWWGHTGLENMPWSERCWYGSTTTALFKSKAIGRLTVCGKTIYVCMYVWKCILNVD